MAEYKDEGILDVSLLDKILQLLIIWASLTIENTHPCGSSSPSLFAEGSRW